MKKPLIALTAAALLLAAAGCAPDTESNDAGTAGASPSAASSPASASASPSNGASGSPDATASPSASAGSSPVVPGFPTDQLPIMPDSTALATSFGTDNEVFTASLTAGTQASTEDIVAYYTAQFADRGYTPTEAENPGSATVRQFIRTGGEEVANVIVVPGEGKSTYTVNIHTLPESAE